MSVAESHAVSNKNLELTVFDIGKITCAIDISHVQEINRHIEITRVYHAPSYVRGVMSLRGQIVTIIDMHTKFGLAPIDINDDMRIIIVRSRDQSSIGLLVDSVDDIVIADSSDVAPPPPNISGICGTFFTGVYKTKKTLIAILNIEEILKLTEK